MKINFTQLDSGPTLAKIERVRDSLSSLQDETVVAYAEFREGLAAWVFGARGIKVEWVSVKAEVLDGVARRFAEECADPSSDMTSLRRDGRQLYDWLVAPVERRLAPGHTLVIEPDTGMAGVPFQALVDGRGQYLGERFPVVFSLGLGFTQQLRNEPRILASQRALVVGAPAATGELATRVAPLPDAAREAREIASRFHNATLLLGAQATLEAVERDLPGAEVFHFSGHSLASATHSGLLLASNENPQAEQDSSSAIFDVTRLRPNQLGRCELVVFSSCSTMRIVQQGAVDPKGLVRGFLRAGVPHVVASRWNVDSAGTTTFMSAFYSALLGGGTVSAAIQAAATQIRNSPGMNHPYYWAAFSSFGRT